MVNAAIREEVDEDEVVEEAGEGMLVVVVDVLVVKAKVAGTEGGATAAAAAAVEAGGAFSMLAFALALASPFQINPPEDREREVEGFSSFWK